MSLERFFEDPWKTSHPGYESSVFNIRPAPEYANSEVVVASLYRALGFASTHESAVPKAGRAFDKACEDARQSDKVGSKVSVDTWRTVLLGVLESPKLPNQSAKRFLQLTPVVPDVALYSGSARLAGNPWNPGALVQRMIVIGADGEDGARGLWKRLFDSTTVSDGDDVWARWLQEEFELRRLDGQEWSYRELETGSQGLSAEDRRSVSVPAIQFTKDLGAIIDAKDFMTRRQWVSLLEAILRLGAVAHVLWLCDVNDRIWRLLRDALEGRTSNVTQRSVRENVISADRPFLIYGNAAVPTIKSYAQRYLSARLGINLVLWELQANGIGTQGLSTSADIVNVVRATGSLHGSLQAKRLLDGYSKMLDLQARAIACKKGIGSNIVEFGRHALGQRQTASELLRGHDQGYVIRKRGEHLAAPWIVSLGPVAVLALVHCCLHEVAGPRSIQWLCAHLARYGVEIDRDDVTDSDLGHKLRMLGLILDSPDAESGMLLVPPFGTATAAAKGGIQ